MQMEKFGNFNIFTLVSVSTDTTKEYLWFRNIILSIESANKDADADTEAWSSKRVGNVLMVWYGT